MVRRETVVIPTGAGVKNEKKYGAGSKTSREDGEHGNLTGNCKG